LLIPEITKKELSKKRWLNGYSLKEDFTLEEEKSLEENDSFLIYFNT